MDLKFIPGLGPKRIKVLQKAGLGDVPALLRNIPRTWLDHTQIDSISSLKEGDSCVLVGNISRANLIYGRRPRLMAHLRDASGQEIALIFFAAATYWHKRLTVGSRWVAISKVQNFRGLQLVHPEMQPLEADEDFTGKITPVYTISEEMRAARMEQGFFRKLYSDIFAADWLQLSSSTPDFLLEYLKCKPELANLRRLHLPYSMGEVYQGRRQLKFLEILPLCLRMVQRRRKLAESNAHKNLALEMVQKARSDLPFQLTAGQEQVIQSILQELAAPGQFHALLQGDVGSGKTVVAMLAMIAICAGEGQAAIMVPTDILARQHLASLRPTFDKLGLNVGLLVGALKPAERRKTLSDLESGIMDAVVGTHALFSKDVAFQQLDLVIIDEQHRFGVQQREALLAKGKKPDMLVMSATPIPRSLAMTLYGDLRPLVMRDMPPGRLPVKTRLVAPVKRADMRQFIARECLENANQCYWIVSKIEADPDSEAQAVDSVVEELRTALPKLRIDFVHGRLEESQRERVLEEFNQGKIHILVSTTVVEVGVNVPAANLMVIDQPERFGLAQLHQLRGRVGRSTVQAWCFLMADQNNSAFERLQAFSQSNDGFEIAELDLANRGAGNLEGAQQSGSWVLRWFDWIKDKDMIEDTISQAEDIIDKKPKFSAEEIEILEEWYQEKRQETDNLASGVH